MDKTVRTCIERELARAEAVVSDPRGIHPPTRHNHEGQVLAFLKIKSLLDIAETQVREPIEVTRMVHVTIASPVVLTIITLLVLCLIF